MSRSDKKRLSDLGKAEVPCGYCGAILKRPGAKFCDGECYRQKRLSQPLEQRFWSKVDRSGDCWLWTASTWKVGYGQFGMTLPDGTHRVVGAHVMAYELTNGPVPEGLEVMHSCNVRLCVRPDHLSAGTHLQNVQDAAAQGAYHVPRPKRHKITAIQVEEIRGLVATGEKQIRVAERFGISETLVSLIMRGKRRQYDAPLAEPLRQVS